MAAMKFSSARIRAAPSFETRRSIGGAGFSAFVWSLPIPVSIAASAEHRTMDAIAMIFFIDSPRL